MVLLKRADGWAAILGTEPQADGTYVEIECPVEPGAIVAGRRVADWPEGVHPLTEAAAYEHIGPPDRRSG